VTLVDPDWLDLLVRFADDDDRPNTNEFTV
jgi:hypothetical protein